MEEQPKTTDLTTSPTTVYERRNIKRIERQDENEEKVSLWEYEEREMTRKEYEDMQNALETPAMQTIMQAIASLELTVEMQGVSLNA